MDLEPGISRSIPRREVSSTEPSIQDRTSSSSTKAKATKISGPDRSPSGTSIQETPSSKPSIQETPSASSIASRAKSLIQRSTSNDEKLRGAEGGGKKRKYTTRRKHKKRTKKKRSKKRRFK